MGGMKFTSTILTCFGIDNRVLYIEGIGDSLVIKKILALL